MKAWRAGGMLRREEEIQQNQENHESEVAVTVKMQGLEVVKQDDFTQQGLGVESLH